MKELLESGNKPQKRNGVHKRALRLQTYNKDHVKIPPIYQTILFIILAFHWHPSERQDQSHSLRTDLACSTCMLPNHVFYNVTNISFITRKRRQNDTHSKVAGISDHIIIVSLSTPICPSCSNAGAKCRSIASLSAAGTSYPPKPISIALTSSTPPPPALVPKSALG